MSTLTFYENGQTFVQETHQNVSKIPVPNQIIPSSINIGLRDYILYLTNNSNIKNLRTFMGQEIKVLTKTDSLVGILLDYNTNPLEIMISNDDGQIYIKDPQLIIYNKTRNNINYLELGNLQNYLNLSYLTNGININYTYHLLLSKNLMDLSCNVQIENLTDLQWPNATVQLMIGEVNKLKNKMAYLESAQSIRGVYDDTETTDSGGYQKIIIKNRKDITNEGLININVFKLSGVPVKLIYKYHLSTYSKDMNKAQWGIEFNTGNHSFPSGQAMLQEMQPNLNNYLGSTRIEQSLVPNINKQLFFGTSKDVVGTHHITIKEEKTNATINIKANLKISKKVDLIYLYYDNYLNSEINMISLDYTPKTANVKFLGYWKDGIYLEITGITTEVSINLVLNANIKESPTLI